MSAAVILDNVTFSYDRHPAVHHISGRFDAGTLTAIAGPNGAGKSTLLKGMAGIVAPDEGRVRIEGAGGMAYLPQMSELMRDFPMTVADMVATGTWHDSGAFGAITKPMRQAISHALDEVGLAGCSNRLLSALSAGQFQRALFARIIVQDAPLILLDEPFTAVDADSVAQLLSVIARWHEQGRTVVCVLHDFAQIRDHFPQCLLMARECIAWGASCDVLAAHQADAARFFREGWGASGVCERAL